MSTNNRVIAVEAVEGTDAMLARVAELREKGRWRTKGRAGFLVKAPKRGQDLRVDLPAIGPDTLRGAEKAGLRGIAVAAGGVLMLDRAALAAQAERAGLFLHGFWEAPMKYFIVTGEPSGDALGAKLLSALRARDPQAEFVGVGGEAMATPGFCKPVPAVRHFGDGHPAGAGAPAHAAAPRSTKPRARRSPRKPDVLVLIDSPDFTHRVAKKARKALPDLRVVDYVSPTVWAWRPGRAKKMQEIIDLVLALLPFEPEAHQRLGGPECRYVGHPLIERLAELHGDEAGRENGPVLVLPGSRRSVLARMGPVFSDALARLHALRPGLEFVLPVAGPVEGLVRAEVETWPVKPRIVAGEAEKYAAFRTARAALAASGTVTLELALSGTPDGGRLQGAEIRGIHRAAADPGSDHRAAQSDPGRERLSGIRAG